MESAGPANGPGVSGDRAAGDASPATTEVVAIMDAEVEQMIDWSEMPAISPETVAAMTAPERMSLMGPPCTYSVEEHQRIGRVGMRGLTMAPLQWPMGASPKNKLTEDQVVQVRRLYDDHRGLTVTQIGALFDVTPQNISMIGRRNTWRHVPEEVPMGY